MHDHVAGWHNPPLGQLFTKLVNGGTPSTAVSAYWNGRIPWVTGADFTSNGIGEIRRHVSDIGIMSSSTSVVDPGNILLVTRTGVGKLAIAKEAIAISQDITGVYVDRNKADVKFIYYLLSAELNNLKKLNQGTSINGIVRSDLERHIVSIPLSIGRQRKIARILQTIDRTIEQTEALIDKYQQIKAGLMHDLFTRGIGPDGQLRPPREQAPHLYQQTPIGWIPKEWNAERLDAVAEVIDPQPDHRTPPAMIDGVPYIGIGDFDKFGIVDFQKCRKVITEAFNKQKERFTAKQGDIIFGKIGTIGEPKVLGDGEYALSANVVLIQPKTQSSYLRQALDSWFFTKQVSDITNTTSQPALGIEKIRAIRIPLPTKDREIDYIAKLLHVIDQKLQSDLCSLNKLQKQKSGLMQDLLTGKVDIKID